MRVGFIGLGNMGAPLARRLIGEHEMVVYDRDPAVLAGFESTGVVTAGSLSDLARRANIVLTCLPTSAHLEALLFGEQSLASVLERGTLVVDMTTGDPAATREMAARLRERSIELIDAPVSGGPRGADAGTIAIIVGGTTDQFERASRVLDSISCNVMHAGGVGTGHAVKVGNNLLNLVCRLATFEAVSLLVRAGVTPETAVSIIQKSSGRSYATEITLPDNILSGKMKQGFSMGLMHKDASLALAIADELAVPMPIGREAFDALGQALAEQGPQADMSEVALIYETRTGARIRP
ncbi:MAG TPA: NAD(P)-dependent oxidoreductase [Arenicellales bacterium]|jgi:3-hydroxyisobutyrate dehydrogenase|nr:NAD(P)-dependent oxidoreductase [Arenicellales bacterium]MDP7218550.1 NAD(P)-dependent oxidoreductase [Arenicellales bacterium]HJP11219.1 NAD(P)-dependent oxidoreductase [Arenicellales bacterium]|tara:strand:- start:1063 stop:1947 length:885 start_codon:yes stop_codon:yes gene_type:complete